MWGLGIELPACFAAVTLDCHWRDGDGKVGFDVIRSFFFFFLDHILDDTTSGERKNRFTDISGFIILFIGLEQKSWCRERLVSWKGLGNCDGLDWSGKLIESAM